MSATLKGIAPLTLGLGRRSASWQIRPPNAKSMSQYQGCAWCVLPSHLPPRSLSPNADSLLGQTPDALRPRGAGRGRQIKSRGSPRGLIVKKPQRVSAYFRRRLLAVEFIAPTSAVSPTDPRPAPAIKRNRPAIITSNHPNPVGFFSSKISSRSRLKNPPDIGRDRRQVPAGRLYFGTSLTAEKGPCPPQLTLTGSGPSKGLTPARPLFSAI